LSEFRLVHATLKPLLQLSLFLTLAGLIAMLSGCAFEQYSARPLDPPTVTAQWQERRLDEPALIALITVERGAPAPPLAEWGSFELTLAAFHFHPDLEAARAQWHAASAMKAIAAQRPMPDLSVRAEHHSRTEDQSSITAGFEIGLPIDLGDRRSARMEEAAALAEAQRLDMGAKAWQIRNRVRMRHAGLLAAESRRGLARREAALRQKVSDLIAARVAAGMATEGQAAEARLQARQGHARQLAEDNALDAARGALAEAIGISPSALLPLVPVAADTGTPVEIPDPEAQRAAVLNRFDLRAGLARYAAAEARLRHEIARQYPDLVLSPGYVYDQGDRIWTIGLSVLAGLIDRNVAGIAAAEAKRESEGRNFLALQTRLITAQAQADSLLRAAMAEQAAATTSFGQTEGQRLAAEKRFAAGLDDRLDLTRQRLDTLAAERILLEARNATARTQGMLEDSLQIRIDASLPTITAPKETGQ
jgi:cobalt-zinc-cadmium efflux system outer membrane protein